MLQAGQEVSAKGVGTQISTTTLQDECNAILVTSQSNR